MKKILDDTGLSYFYGKMQQIFATQSSVSGKANSADLATVATSGSYNDLSNKPTIPQIWSGTQAQYDLIASPDPNTIYIITSAS